MTSPGINKPSDQVNGYEQVHSAGTRFGQDLSEAKVRSLLSGRVVNPFERFTTGLLGGIADALRGIFNPSGAFADVGRAAKEIRDGQLELNGRTDLLSPLLDYGSCFAPDDNTRLHGSGYINFSRQIGPMRGCRVEGDRLVLEDKGLWDIRAHVSMDALFSVAKDYALISLRVFRPDGSPYSEQISAIGEVQTTSTTIVSSVVVPEPGYYIRVYVNQSSRNRGILAGPSWSRLTAQHISRDTKVGGTGTEHSTQPTEEEE